MGIHVCSLAKQIQSSFDKSLNCHEILVRMQIPKVLSARHAFVVVVVVVVVFQEAFCVLSYDFQVSICDNCLWSLTGDICYVSRTGEAGSLLPQNLETV